MNGNFAHNIDKIIRQRIENLQGLGTNAKTTHRVTGSILNIKNLEKDLVLENNIFEDNVGYTGTGLLVNQFASGKRSPILIKNNIFTRNFALRFGLSLVILNNDIDYY